MEPVRRFRAQSILNLSDGYEKCNNYYFYERKILVSIFPHTKIRILEDIETTDLDIYFPNDMKQPESNELIPKAWVQSVLQILLLEKQIESLEFKVCQEEPLKQIELDELYEKIDFNPKKNQKP